MIHYQIDPKLKIKKIDEVFDSPITVVVNKFDEASAKDFRKQFADALNTGQKIVPIVIDSYGGQVYSLMSMIATIKSSPVPVATIATGKAMSCGAILFTFGTEGLRFMDPFATIMIHDCSSMAWGKIEELKADTNEAERLNKLVYTMMAKNCGKSDDYFTKIVHDEKGHADWYLTSEECKSHNIANHLRVPNFKVKVSTEITFE